LASTGIIIIVVPSILGVGMRQEESRHTTNGIEITPCHCAGTGVGVGDGSELPCENWTSAT